MWKSVSHQNGRLFSPEYCTFVPTKPVCRDPNTEKNSNSASSGVVTSAGVVSRRAADEERRFGAGVRPQIREPDAQRHPSTGSSGLADALDQAVAIGDGDRERRVRPCGRARGKPAAGNGRTHHGRGSCRRSARRRRTKAARRHPCTSDTRPSRGLRRRCRAASRAGGHRTSAETVVVGRHVDAVSARAARRARATAARTASRRDTGRTRPRPRATNLTALGALAALVVDDLRTAELGERSAVEHRTRGMEMAGHRATVDRRGGLRVDGLADVHGVRAPGVVAASRRRIDRTRRITLERRCACGHARVCGSGHRNRRDQRFRVRVTRIGCRPPRPRRPRRSCRGT